MDHWLDLNIDDKDLSKSDDDFFKVLPPQPPTHPVHSFRLLSSVQSVGVTEASLMLVAAQRQARSACTNSFLTSQTADPKLSVTSSVVLAVLKVIKDPGLNDHHFYAVNAIWQILVLKWEESR